MSVNHHIVENNSQVMIIVNTCSEYFNSLKALMANFLYKWAISNKKHCNKR